MDVLIHKNAQKYLNRLKPADRDRFDDAIENMKKEPPKGDIRSYEGNPGMLRLRVGNYRVIFTIENDTIFITYIEPRGQAYTKKTRTKRGEK